MARGRKTKPVLTESWDNVDSSLDLEDIYDTEEEQREMGSQYKASFKEDALSSEDDERLTRSQTSAPKTRKGARASTKENGHETSRRTARFETEPELVMPRSPDAVREAKSSQLRAQTPHFRLNQRSLTSDAGFIRRQAEQQKEKKAVDNQNPSIWQSFMQPALSYILEIVGMALNLQIVKYAFALWVLLGAVFLARNFATNSINHALSPLCRIPAVSWFGPSFCAVYTSTEIAGHAEFDTLMSAQSQFHEVLSSSAHGAMLPLDMKRSEASIRDLRQVVQYSSLPSRNELVFEFGGFIDTARQASSDLSRFNIHIGSAVDRILSTNRWTLNVIEGVATADANKGSIAKFFSKNLNIFAPFQPLALSRDVLLDQYLRHTSAVEEQVLSLIDEAHVLLGVLDNLDGRLDVIAGIATRDGITIEEGRDALFANLWTKLGGNRNSVHKLENQINLLREVGQYRKLAWAHVSGTIIKLQAIRDQLEDLRERVALPETVGDKIPLETHIEHINLGIERLEAERDASRKLMDANNARILAKSERLIDSKRLDA